MRRLLRWLFDAPLGLRLIWIPFRLGVGHAHADACPTRMRARGMTRLRDVGCHA